MTKGIKKWSRVTSWEDVPQVLDVDWLMRLLRISKPTALKYLADGRIPARKVGNQWRIDKDAVRVYLRGDGEEAA